MINKSAILAGALGGIIPNMLRLAINLTSESPRQIVHGWGGYIIGALLLAILGGAVAWAWQESNLRKALFLGIGLPSLIQVAGLQSSQTDNSRGRASVRQPMTSLPFVSSAYAQTPTPTAEGFVIPGRQLTTVSVSPGAPLPTIVFFNRDGQQIATANVAGTTRSIIDVPESATAFAGRVGDSSSEPIKLPDTPNATKTAEIKVNAGTGSGFLQALGFAAPDRYNISVSLADPRPITEGFCKFGIQVNADGTWSERLFDPVDSKDAAAIPTPGSVLVAKQDINLRSDFPRHVEGKGLYFRPIIGLLRSGQKVVVKEIKPFELAKETHYWMEFAPVENP